MTRRYAVWLVIVATVGGSAAAVRGGETQCADCRSEFRNYCPSNQGHVDADGGSQFVDVTRGAHISGGCGTCMQHNLCMEGFAAAEQAIEDVRHGEATIEAALTSHSRHLSLDAERAVVTLRDCHGQNVAAIALAQPPNIHKVLSD